MRALALVPAVVAAGLDAIDLLPPVLADVAGPELARVPVEAETPRIAEAPGEDLGTRELARAVEAFRVVRERVVRGNAVRNAARAAVDVDAQDCAEQRRRVLAVAVRIAGAAAVTQPDIEETVRPEHDVAAVVIGARLRERQHHFLGGEIDGAG